MHTFNFFLLNNEPVGLALFLHVSLLHWLKKGDVLEALVTSKMCFSYERNDG